MRFVLGYTSGGYTSGGYGFRGYRFGNRQFGSGWFGAYGPVRWLGAFLLVASSGAAADPTAVPTAATGNDLQIWSDYRHGSAQPGRPFRLTVSVINNGPDVARDVRVRLSLPDGLQQIDTLGCDNDPQGMPDCAFGAMAPDATRAFSLRAMTPPGEYAAMPVSARVLAAGRDPAPGNNTTAIEVRPAFPEPAVDAQGMVLLVALVLTFASVLFLMVRESQRDYRLMRPRP